MECKDQNTYIPNQHGIPNRTRNLYITLNFNGFQKTCAGVQKMEHVAILS